MLLSPVNALPVHRVLTTLMLIFLSVYLNGQDCIVTVEIRNEINEPLPYAYTFTSVSSQESNEAGVSTLEFNCDGDTLNVSYFGYVDTVLILNKATEKLSVQLLLDPYLTKEVIKHGHKTKIHNESEHQTISGDQLDAHHGNLGDVIATISGVNAIHLGNNISKPVIHGLTGDRIIIVENGNILESQQWGTDHAPELDPLLYDEVTVIKNSGTIQYSTKALGGVLSLNDYNLFTQKPLQVKVLNTFETNGKGLYSALKLGGSNGKWGWNTKALYKKSGDKHAPDYSLANTGAEINGIKARLGRLWDKKYLTIGYSYNAGNLGILRSSHIGNLTDLQKAIDREILLPQGEFTYDIASPRQTYDHQIFDAEFANYFDFGKISIRQNIQMNNRAEYDIRRRDNNKPALNLNKISSQSKLQLDHTPIGKFKGQVGLFSYLSESNNQPGTGVLPLVPDNEVFNFGFYLSENFLTGKWNHTIGARLEREFLSGDLVNRSRAIIPFQKKNTLYSFNYELSKKIRSIDWVINGLYSERAPNVNELYSNGLHHSSSSFEIGDQTITKERLLKMSTSLHTSGDTWDFSLNGYAEYFDGYINLSPSKTLILTTRGAFPSFNFTHQDAIIYGFDFDSHVDLFEDCFLVSSFSVIQSHNFSKDITLFNIPVSDISNSINFHFFPNSIHLDGKIEYNYFFEKKSSQEIVDFSAPPKPYGILNATLEKTFQLKDDHRIRAILNGNNLTNETYRSYLDRIRYFADAPGSNIIMSLFYYFK